MANFNFAVIITLRPDHEGGYQCIPTDKGNWTGGHVGMGELKGSNHGISAAQFPDLDIKNMTMQQAIDIYQKEYWNPLYDKIEDQNFANKLFDVGVMSGVGTAVSLFQGLMNLAIDRNFGPKCLEAVNASEPASLLKAYKATCVTYVISLGAKDANERPFVSDWIRRINF